MQTRNLIAAIAVLALTGAWYAFRPERLFINQTVNESFPAPQTAMAAAQPAPIYSGRFHDGAHKTSGSATVYQLPDGKRVLRLSEFETSNGPDVQVYMVAAPDALDRSRSGAAASVSTSARPRWPHRDSRLRRLANPGPFHPVCFTRARTRPRETRRFTSFLTASACFA